MDWPIDDLRKWIEAGDTHATIANRLGCASQTVSKLCKRHGIQSRRRGPRSGPGHPNWTGGVVMDKSGYRMIWTPDHPNARKQHRRHPGGYVLEHRLVMEAHLGRYLKSTEVVHHRNNDKLDNRIENLELFESNAQHLRTTLAGKCPQWTEAGKARLRDTIRAIADRRRGIPRKSKRDAHQ